MVSTQDEPIDSEDVPWLWLAARYIVMMDTHTHTHTPTHRSIYRPMHTHR